jgi:hypothetical protein
MGAALSSAADRRVILSQIHCAPSSCFFQILKNIFFPQHFSFILTCERERYITYNRDQMDVGKMRWPNT